MMFLIFLIIIIFLVIYLIKNNITISDLFSKAEEASISVCKSIDSALEAARIDIAIKRERLDFENSEKAQQLKKFYWDIDYLSSINDLLQSYLQLSKGSDFIQNDNTLKTLSALIENVSKRIKKLPNIDNIIDEYYSANKELPSIDSFLNELNNIIKVTEKIVERTPCLDDFLNSNNFLNEIFKKSQDLPNANIYLKIFDSFIIDISRGFPNLNTLPKIKNI